YILHVSERNSRIDHLVRVGDKCIPLVISGHRNGTHSKLLHGVIGFISFSLENAGICVVGFLDLANNNRLELTPGVLQIEVSLKEISWLKCRGMGDSIPYVNSSP